MAKIKHPFITLQGTLGGLTFVSSKTYGAHTRMPRGTYKKTVPNAVLQANADKAKAVTEFAKALLPLLKNEYGAFVQKGLWQQMLKRLFRVPVASVPQLIAALEGLEINAAYPMERIVLPPEVAWTITRGALKLKLVFNSHAQPANDLKCDGYYYAVQVVWTDGKQCEGAVQETAWARYNDPFPVYEITFAKPRWATDFLLVLKVTGGRCGNETESFRGMGVSVLQLP